MALAYIGLNIAVGVNLLLCGSHHLTQLSGPSGSEWLHAASWHFVPACLDFLLTARSEKNLKVSE